MSPILFYGVPSGCSLGSIVALEWRGKPYRLCRIEMPEVASSTEYRRINPVAETPSLLSGNGEVISESLAILNHIGADATESGLAFAQGTPGFDRLNQMLAFLNTTFFSAFSPLWFAIEERLDDGEKRALTGYGRTLVERAHAQLEGMLGDKPWLLGEQRTLADAYFIGIARWTKYHDVVDRRDYPNLQRLYDKLEADPGVKFAHAIEGGRAVSGSRGFQGEISLDEALQLLKQAA